MDKYIKKFIDEKDRKILTELDKDARQPDSEIAKKAGLSKQVVNFRIKKLVERGIVPIFYTIINTGKLGLNSYYIFLQLQKINKTQEKELLKKLNDLDYVGWLASGVGRWDVVLLIYADSISTFDRLFNNVLDLCGEHLHEHNFATLIRSEHISYKFLAETRYLESVKQTEKSEIVMLGEEDKKILEAISQNSRMPLTEISEKTKIPLHVVNYHIKSMIKDKVIEGFKPKIDVSKIDYQWNLLLIQFQRTTEERKKEFIDFCRNHKKIYYITNTIGIYNLLLDIYVKNTKEFRDVLLELKDKFSDVIKLYESIVIFDEYKINYFPKGLLKK